MTPIGADAVTAITNRFVAPEVVDGVYTSNILLARWYRGNKIMRQGGTQIEQPMIYRKGNNGGSSNRGCPLDTPDSAITRAGIAAKGCS